MPPLTIGERIGNLAGQAAFIVAVVFLVFFIPPVRKFITGVE